MCQFAGMNGETSLLIENQVLKVISIPIESMYGIFTYIYDRNHLIVTIYVPYMNSMVYKKGRDN